MNRFLALAVLSVSLAAPGAPATCDQAGVDALLARVDQAVKGATVIDSLPGRSYDESRQRCAQAAQLRVESGKTDEFLICESRPADYGGGIHFGGRLNGRVDLFKAFTTDLKSLDPKLADELCIGINGCLFELSEQKSSPLYQRLSAAWDGLSCPGE